MNRSTAVLIWALLATPVAYVGCRPAQPPSGTVPTAQAQSFPSAVQPQRSWWHLPTEDVFTLAATRYRGLLDAGFKPDKAGAGHLPVHNRPLFNRYAHFHYLPEEAHPLITSNAIPFLSVMVQPTNQDSHFAEVCLSIAQSKRREARPPSHVESYSTDGTKKYEGGLVLWHYD